MKNSAQRARNGCSGGSPPVAMPVLISQNLPAVPGDPG